MEIALTPEIERQLAEAIASGRFVDPAEAVAEGLRLLLADQDAGTDLPEWLRIDESPDGSVPAAVEAALDRAAEDVRLGRVVDAETVLARMDAKIAAYHARRNGSVAR